MFPIIVIISTFLPHVMFRQIQGNIKHIILRTLLHSSLCVLNFMLPNCRPNFAKVARISYKTDVPSLVDGAKGIAHRNSSAQLPHNLIENLRSLPEAG
jgi:hypothetical protein